MSTQKLKSLHELLIIGGGAGAGTFTGGTCGGASGGGIAVINNIIGNNAAVCAYIGIITGEIGAGG